MPKGDGNSAKEVTHGKLDTSGDVGPRSQTTRIPASA